MDASASRRRKLKTYGPQRKDARPKPIPFPHVEIFAPLKVACTAESFGPFVSAFAKRANDPLKEVVWSATETGALIETLGVRETVTPRLPPHDLVVAEIHNHPAPRNPRYAFLQLSDLAVSFSSAERVYGLYTVLIADPEAPYVVACKLDEPSIKMLQAGDMKPHETLLAKLRSIQGSAAEDEGFLVAMKVSGSIQELLALYKRTLPRLDFRVLKLDEKLTVIADSSRVR